MNYNSVLDVISSGISNMTVIRDNNRNDDDMDYIEAPSWLTFCGQYVTNNIQVNGNSYISLYGSQENLCINKRDGACWYLYYEIGNVKNNNFLKIKWRGQSYYSDWVDSRVLEYDVIFWDNENISIHMIAFPTEYNTGTYRLSDLNYNYYSCNDLSPSSPDVTFYRTNNGYEVKYELFDPVIKKYLIKSNNNYYNLNNDMLNQLSISTLNSTVFNTYGMDEIPDLSLVLGLSNPEILHWTDIEDKTLSKGLVLSGAPSLPHTIYFNDMPYSSGSPLDKILIDATSDVLFSISLDSGLSWKHYNHESQQWIPSTDNNGMTLYDFNSIPIDILTNYFNTSSNGAIQFKCILQSTESKCSKIYIKYKS